VIDWPQQLVKDLARRRAILFLGSGVSKNATSTVGAPRHPPTWDEFLRVAFDKCANPKRHIQALLKERDYLTACEILKHKLDEQWTALVHEQFVEPGFAPAEIHRDIFKLDSRIVLTQNVDKIYDTFALGESSGTVYVKEYSKTDIALVVRGDKRCVLKAHGTVDTPDEMIFTREEYSRARVDHSAFYDVLDALTVTHTILFLGCGLSDPDVQIMLETHAYSFPGSRPHYMVAPSGSLHADVQDSLKRNLNIRFLFYKPNDNHKDLRDSLRELVGLVETQRGELVATRDW
jgi:SIR2-like domain